jgi:hypothetical protein
MSIKLDCICGNKFEADEAQIGTTINCGKLAFLITLGLVYQGLITRSPTGSLLWHVAAAATMIDWLLLLERPTTPPKLTIAITIGLVTQLAITALGFFSKSS